MKDLRQLLSRSRSPRRSQGFGSCFVSFTLVCYFRFITAHSADDKVFLRKSKTKCFCFCRILAAIAGCAACDRESRHPGRHPGVPRNRASETCRLHGCRSRGRGRGCASGAGEVRDGVGSGVAPLDDGTDARACDDGFETSVVPVMDGQGRASCQFCLENNTHGVSLPSASNVKEFARATCTKILDPISAISLRSVQSRCRGRVSAHSGVV